MNSRLFAFAPGLTPALAALAIALWCGPAHPQRAMPSELSGTEIPGAMPGGAGRSTAPTATPDTARAAAPLRGGAIDNETWPPAPQVNADPRGCSRAITGSGSTYNVGPNQKYNDLSDVPWLSLRAGDVVNIHHRAEPYRSKIGLRGQGTADAPIVINGVTDAQCQRPEITGDNAQTVNDARRRPFFSKQYSENLGVFLIYKAPTDPYGYRPKHLQFRNLKITGGHQDYTYTAQDGSQGRYGRGAAGIYAIVVEDLLIENCEITRNGNGLFVNSKSGDEASNNLIVRHSRLFDNGVAGSWFEHNLYVQTRRSLYEGNYIGQLIPKARGSSLKDRSSATVVRFNHIAAAARALDLVEIEGGVPQVLNDPYYNAAWVYGNLIVDEAGNDRAFSVKLIHWGGDNDPRYFRKGRLWFYNNTVVLKIDKRDFYYVSLFDMPTADQKVSLRANIFQNLGSAQVRLGQERGTIDLDDTNLFTGGYSEGASADDLKVTVIGRVLDNRNAGLNAQARPTPGAPGTDLGQLTPLRMPAGIVTDNLRVSHQFVAPAGLVPRVQHGAAMDLGAFEFSP